MMQAPPRSSVVVREVQGIGELQACQELQRKAWGITEDGYVVPIATMASVQRLGGLILGAFDTNQQLVGFAFAYLGKLDGRLLLWSQLTGVHPAQQSTGVGRLLKLEQRRRAREMGLPAVAWAFDPLQASNAAFNLGVLGATAKVYEVDMYGPRTDALNAGLATDRIICEWDTSGDAGGQTRPWSDAADLVVVSSSGDLAPVNPIPREATHLSIEIPANLATLKSSSPLEVARAWQAATREAFQTAFAAGYVAVGFSRADPAHPRYLLERSR